MAFGLSQLKNIFTTVKSDGAGVVGVDIGSSSIKVVQIKDVKGRATLETYGELQLGPYADLEIGQATNIDQNRLTEALVDIIRESSVSSKQAALAISYSSSFVTVISLPNVAREQLASMVPIEARKYVPVPISEVTLDWFVIPEEKKDAAQRVLLAAIHNEALNKYRGVLRDALLVSKFSEIEIFSTIRSSVLQEDTCVAILDLGAGASKLYIVKKGIVLRSHSITSGAQDLTRLISNTYSIPLGEAEELKRKNGLMTTADNAKIADAIAPGLEQIFREARLVLSRFEEQSGDAVEKIILTGGGSTLKYIDEFAEASFEKTVMRANPFEKVEYPAFLEETLKEAGPSFSVAIGVALRLLNES